MKLTVARSNKKREWEREGEIGKMCKSEWDNQSFCTHNSIKLETSQSSSHNYHHSLFAATTGFHFMCSSRGHSSIEHCWVYSCVSVSRLIHHVKLKPFVNSLCNCLSKQKHHFFAPLWIFIAIYVIVCLVIKINNKK